MAFHFTSGRASSSHPKAVRHVSSNLLDPLLIQFLPNSNDFPNVLSIEWSAIVLIASAYISVSELPLPKLLTKFTHCNSL